MTHKKQHIVPETYLKYFSPNEDGKKISVLSLQNRYSRKIKNYNSGDSIFWKKDYYNSKKIKNPKLLELFLGQKIETNYNNIVKKISDEIPFDDHDFKIRFFEYIFYSKLRSPVWRTFIKTIIDPQNPNKNNDPTNIKEEHLRLFFDSDVFESVLKYYSDNLTFKKWNIIISSSEQLFISSDNPGFCFNYTDYQKNDKSFYKNPLWTNIQFDTLLYFPLTKKYCLLIEPYKKNDEINLNFSNDLIYYQSYDTEKIKIVNSWTVLTSNEYIFSSDRKELIEYESILNST